MINSLVLLEQQHIEKFIEAINKLESFTEAQVKQIAAPVSKPSSTQKMIDDIKNYIPLKDAWILLNISKQKWYRTYQHIIQHKQYDNSSWVYLPSILKFLKENNINE
jgi:hypothetical protein